MAHKRRHGNRWEYIFKRKHLLPKAVTYRFDDEAEGDTFARRLEQLLDAGVVPPELLGTGTPHTLHRAIRDYTSQVTIKREDHLLLALWMRATPPTLLLSALDFDWCHHHIKAFKQVSNLSPGTIKKKMGALSRCLRWCVARQWTLADPTSLLPRGYAQYAPADLVISSERLIERKIDIERDRRLQPGEEERVLTRLDALVDSANAETMLNARSYRALYVLAIETAMRMREMYTLTLNQVDLQGRTVFLEKTKNGSKRQIPLSSVAVACLREHLIWCANHVAKWAPQSRIFPWLHGDSLTDADLKGVTAMLSARYAGLFSRLGCDDLTFHDLRHEAVSRLFERTKLSDAKIMKISGHSSFAMLNRYANLRASDLANELW
jgi:integrase